MRSGRPARLSNPMEALTISRLWTEAEPYELADEYFEWRRSRELPLPSFARSLRIRQLASVHAALTARSAMRAVAGRPAPVLPRRGATDRRAPVITR